MLWFRFAKSLEIECQMVEFCLKVLDCESVLSLWGQAIMACVIKTLLITWYPHCAVAFHCHNIIYGDVLHPIHSGHVKS